MHRRPSTPSPPLVLATGVFALLLGASVVSAIALRASTGRTAGATRPHPAAPAVRDVYAGLGSWVDLYDSRAWADPAGAVRAMASHGVRTLFVETASAGSRSGIVHPGALRTFITEAHAHHMHVVAWYMPYFTSPALDFDRASQAIRFTTDDGQRFDSFALDIESTAVSSQASRNSRLMALSSRLRTKVGERYPLGAIIPSPVGLTNPKNGWSSFPYSELSATYDVFLPMNYYTFDIRTSAPVHEATLGDARILRSQPGCASIPIHMIGGIAEDSSAAQVRQFVRACREAGCVGAGLYGWSGTSRGEWHELAPVRSFGK